MIERKPIIVACVAGTLFASCTPYPSNYRKNPNPPGQAPKKQQTVTSQEQQRLQEERKKAQEEAERKAAQQQTTPDNGGTTAPDSATPPAKTEYEYATPVPGRPGFVLSPYNGKMIDVKGIPSGTLVADPAYPASEKKYFLVP